MRALGGWENELVVTTVEDVGRIVAEIVLTGLEERGVVYVAGDVVSMWRLADVVEMALGRSVKRSVGTVEQLERELEEDPGDAMRKYRVVFAAGVGVSWDLKETFNFRHDMSTVSVEEWARQNLGAP